MKKYISYESLKNPIPPEKWGGKTILRLMRVPFNWTDSLVIVLFTDWSIRYIRGAIYESAKRKDWEQNYLWDRPILGKKDYPVEIEGLIEYLFKNRLFSPVEYDEFVEGRKKEREEDLRRQEEYNQNEELEVLARLKRKYETH